MFVKEMDTDFWHDNDCEGSVLESPTSSDIVAAVKALDASARTTVTLQADGQHHMTIGGGNGQYLVYSTRDNDNFFNLLGDAHAEGDVLLFVGGQEGRYPARQIIGQERAITAAVTFALTGSLDATLEWEEQI